MNNDYPLELNLVLYENDPDKLFEELIRVIRLAFVARDLAMQGSLPLDSGLFLTYLNLAVSRGQGYDLSLNSLRNRYRKGLLAQDEIIALLRFLTMKDDSEWTQM